jgi:FkbM family methyltransferase
MNLRQTQDIGFGSFIVLENDLIGNFILRHGYWEQHLYAIYSQFIKPEHVIIDAGANIGFHTIQFAKLGKLVYAFEPQSLIFNLLSTNILMNDVNENVKQYRLGLYNDDAILNMQSIEQFTEPNGVLNLGGRGVTTDQIDTEKIDLVSWDKHFSNVEHVDFIKMDIQGAELSALKGMEKLLKKSKPWMLLENYDNENDARVVEYLTSIGYEIYRPMNALPNEDCICIHKDYEQRNELKSFLSETKIDWKIYN